jgi:hypothetical protein
MRIVLEGNAKNTGAAAWIASLTAIALAAAILLAMGRPPICTCGYVKLWEGVVNSAGNSQHIADWYSLSHIIHGFVFYGALWLVARRWSFAVRLFAATLVEAAWEIAENTNWVIDRYREATMALGYTGDSVLNSVSDIAMMMLGFWLAARLPVWATVAVAVAFELLALYAIRDNLTLNVLMLLWPIDAIRVWQAG